jgi:hypothetical protein
LLFTEKNKTKKGSRSHRVTLCDLLLWFLEELESSGFPFRTRDGLTVRSYEALLMWDTERVTTGAGRRRT